MPKILYLHHDGAENEPAKLNAAVAPSAEMVHCRSTAEALLAMQQQSFDGVLLSSQTHTGNQKLSDLIEAAAVFDLLPNGIAILDGQNKITRANQRLIDWFPNRQLIGLNFYEALGNPTIIGPEASPLTTAVAQKTACCTTIEVDTKYFRLQVTPVLNANGECHQRLISLIDCTESVQQRQKLEALHQAGAALADLRPEEIYEMDFEHRIDLLKQNILHYTKDLLNFDVVEIRLLEEETGLMKPLLSEGIDASQAKRPMYALPTGNGVTGFVGATGKSYLCEDTTNDPLYVKGLIGAKSSLTVPLIYHDDVIGSFNVESPEIKAFSESDLQFLEAFSRDVAVALNTLELLTAQQTNTALQSVEAIRSAVVLPVDEILNDTVHAIDAYQGNDPVVTKRLQDILQNAREIKRMIQRVGEAMSMDNRSHGAVQYDHRPNLREKRILVIDADEEIRTSAHCLLERYGCVVETAHEGREAILMIRNSGLTNAYDAIIADIRLPDISGYDLLIQLKTLVEDPPLILMTGYGYDPGHSIVKARQAGLRANAVMAKPFRLEQLLDTVESAIQEPVL